MSDFSDWVKVKLGDLTEGFRGVSYQPTDLMDSYTDESVVLLRANNIQNGKLLLNDIQIVPKRIVKSFQYLATDDIAVCMSNGSKHLVGKSAQFSSNNHLICTVGAFCSIFRTKKEAEPAFVKQLFHSPAYQAHIDISLSGSAINNLKNSDIESIIFKVPPKAKQQKIATILTSIDTAIEKTEALIEKYQQIKSGLMHDLFTRGVLPNGQLRPTREQAPELYQETKIGWIPREWGVRIMGDVLDSISDGPFGSNLKTEHYVPSPGVRVVRLQNISAFDYNDNDRAYVSHAHANFLNRNKVVSGDVLIAGLGEERYPVGRACCYPEGIDPAINKADCFRARANVDILVNKFLMLFLNSEIARPQVRRLEQGVTRPRINTGNFKKILVPTPNISEQNQFIQKFESVSNLIDTQLDEVKKLRLKKLGLMQDLLTGKVPVTVSENADQEEAHA